MDCNTCANNGCWCCLECQKQGIHYVEQPKNPKYQHFGIDNPNYKDGRKKTRLYRIYYNMKSRCNNPKVPCYKRYGGAGVKIYDEWLNDFTAFQDWALQNGYTDDLTIDRIDNSKGYSPDNCRWVTTKKQSRNKSSNNLVSINGITKTLKDWCGVYNINYQTVQDRLRRKWEPVKALTTPIDARFNRGRQCDFL